MIVSVKGQAVLFLVTVLLGFFIGFLYDIIRVLRKIITHSNIIIQIEDIIYWVIVSLVMFAMMLRQNYGEIRAFSIIGAFLGILLYYLILSQLFMKASLTLVDILKKIITTILTIMFYPIKLVLKLLSYPAKFIKAHLKKAMYSSRKKYNYAKKIGKLKSKKMYRNLKIMFKNR